MMNFEWFRDLQHRLIRVWLEEAQKLSGPDFVLIKNYLKEDPNTCTPTSEHEQAYELLMDARMNLQELSHEIDLNHDDYMLLMKMTSESPDLMMRLMQNLSLEQKNLLELELMIMEQVSEWEIDNHRINNNETRNWHNNNTQRLIVHLPDKSTRTLCLSNAEEKRYWPNVCPITFKQGDLKVCSGCRVVRYFSGKEQKIDWNEHKHICKIIKEARGEKLYWQQSMCRAEMALFMRKKLKRPLNQYEQDIIDFSPTCLLTDEAPDDLKASEIYPNVFFKPNRMKEGEQKMRFFCQQIQLAADNYCNAMVIGHQAQSYRPQKEELYSKLALDMKHFFEPILPMVVSNKLEGYQLSELHYLSFLYTCPLTLLYGLEALKCDFEVEKRTELTVHLIGARRAEMRFIEAWQILPLRLPKLQKLNLVFIGDECDNDLPGEFGFLAKNLQQNGNNEDGIIRREVNYCMEKKCFYQDYLQSDRASRPDVICALDCGFKFYDAWRPALRMIGERLKKTPVIFTEFTESDMHDNLSIVQNLMKECQLVLGPVENPYRSLAPIRCRENIESYRQRPIIFTNDVICVVKA